jgi:hypothetical protein
VTSARSEALRQIGFAWFHERPDSVRVEIRVDRLRGARITQGAFFDGRERMRS